jgi:adenine-specific DNA-methyltransferase
MDINDIIKSSSEFNQKDKKSIKENGVVFTNKHICDLIIKKINPKINETICEPSVGKGAFIFSLFEYFRENNTIEEIADFFNNRLYCYDINNVFLDSFKKLVVEYFNYYGYDKELKFDNIINDDFLLSNNNYDVIIGNPPYVRIQNMNKEYLNILKLELKSVTLGNIDLYYAFLEKSLIYSKKVGFIIPNSFIKNKSGFFIRNIIKNRLSYLYDFKNEKVWSNISTYTSIVICDETDTENFTYESNNKIILKSKKDLLENNWVFDIQKKDINTKTNKLIDMINHYSGGLATIKDDVFKMDSYDDLYCYKGIFKIEKEICKKYIKGTKSRTFDDYKYIIYPYNINGKILKEEDLREKYPLAYEYLLSRKEDLLSRDKGKTSKYDSWYSYGRRQGLLKEKKGDCIILPLTFLKSRNIHYIDIPKNEECLVLSGILVDIKDGMKENFIKVIKSDDFYYFCENNNKILSDKNKIDDLWLTISASTIKDYTY